ncbi:DUF1850 domain-containing protein [Murdochiella sp. Marseille-P8839]|nr:DUF1850 domain-containing protein [Murdochiella sp. Marseille-P8839]
MASRHKIALWAAVLALVVAVAFLLVGNSASAGHELVLRSGKTGKVFARYPMAEGDTFTITFIHSVNQKPYSDMYRIENETIYAEETRFAEFGAGVETELNEGEILSTGKDGEIVISNIHTPMKHLSYIVGTVSDHILTVGEKEISLRDLCGRNATVVFTYEKK